MNRTIPLLLSLCASLALMAAAVSTVRAFVLAHSSSASEAAGARRRAVAHWTGAVLLTVVTWVVRARLPAPGGRAQNSVSMPWRTVGVAAAAAAAAVAVVAVLAVVGQVGRGRHERQRQQRSARWALHERIGAVGARHDAVLEEHGEHLVDFLAALQRPALNDPRVGATERFDRAMIDADDARLSVCHGAAEPLVAAYHAAVAELEVSWRLAREHAERVGTSYLEPAVSRRLARAAVLMAAVRGGASEHERARVRRLVGTCVRVPQRAALAVEHLLRPALPAGGLDAVVRADRAKDIEPLTTAWLRQSLDDLP